MGPRAGGRGLRAPPRRGQAAVALQTHPPCSGVCEMEQLLPSFPAQPKKTKPGLGWRGRNAARRQTQLERPEAVPGEGGLAIPPSAVLPLVLPLPHGSAGVKVLDLGFSLENWKGLPGLWGCFFFFFLSLAFLELGELSLLRVLPGFSPEVGLSGSTQSSV